MELVSEIVSVLPSFASLRQTPDTLIAALISSLATIALIVVFLPIRKLKSGDPSNGELPDRSEVCEFVINGGSLKAATTAGRILLEDLGNSKSKLTLLKQYLQDCCPTIHQDLDALVVDGFGFRHHCPRADGSAIEIFGEPRGNAALLSIRPASEDARALQRSEDTLSQAKTEIAFLRRVVDCAPALSWIVTPDNQVTWANTPYCDRFDPGSDTLRDFRIANAFSHVLETVPLTPRGPEVRARKLVASPGDVEPQWYEVSEIAAENGSKLCFALETNELVAAEASLRRFVETLTETFAHLPIGLAVFDKNRRLGLFNPSLSELVKIDAVWLSGRPSLRDFLERLRETRQMPDQKDFTAWRRKLSELEEGARHGTYQENWMLPNGKVFRVTGRPHPQGALAFLFEDISAAVSLERKYRSELELSQATLDKLNEAVAVFDASGSLVFVNAAFERLWDIDPMQSLEGPAIGDMTSLWAEKCLPSPVWAQLEEFATAEEARTTWSSSIEARDGRILQILVAPLPDASALVVFRNVGTADAGIIPAEPMRAVLDEMAFNEIRVPAESAIKQVLAASLEPACEPSLRNIAAALQGLKDGIERSRQFRDLARNTPDVGKAALPALSAALGERGISLDAPEEARTWDARMRSTAMALGLAIADDAHEHGSVRISLATNGSHNILTVETDSSDADVADNGRSVSVARRIVHASGGEIKIDCTARKFSVQASLPHASATEETGSGQPNPRVARG
ncbi:MAG: PAS-domain containing protein [Pseudomonadota bacterium]